MDSQGLGAINPSEEKLSATIGPASWQEQNMTENQGNPLYYEAAYTKSQVPVVLVLKMMKFSL